MSTHLNYLDFDPLEVGVKTLRKDYVRVTYLPTGHSVGVQNDSQVEAFKIAIGVLSEEVKAYKEGLK